MILDKSPNNKAERFMNYKWIEMQKYLKYWKMEDEVRNKELRRNILSKENDVLRNVNNFKKKFNVTKGQLSTWSGVSIENMAQKIGMLGEYNLMYRTCCSFSHPGFLGALQGVDRGRDYTIFSPKPSFEHIVVNLKSAVQYLHEFLVIFDHIFKLEMEEKLDDFQKRALKVFEMDKYKL